jgi:hypothetical protein
MAGGMFQGNKIDPLYAKSATEAGAALSNLASSSQTSLSTLDSMFSGVSTHMSGFDDALRIVANPTKWDSILGGANSVASAIAGTDSTVRVAKTQFEQFDTTLTNMPADEAAAAFRRIQDKATALHVPTENLVKLFPQYSNKVESASGKMGTAAEKAFAMAGGVAAIQRNVNGFNLAKLERINAEANRSLGLTPGFGPTLSANFAGGTVSAGQTSITGELGPEMTVSRSGKFGMVGLNGPQLFTPGQETAVLPSSATFNPLGGNYGNAPDWARMALQRAVNSSGPLGTPATNKARRSEPAASHYDFSGWTVGSNVDVSAVKNAVMSAIDEKERDRRERR